MRIEESEIPLLIKSGKEREVISFLYKKVFPNVKKYIVSNRGTRDDALDVFQDAMMAFYTNVLENKFDADKYKVYGYIFRMSINRWINKLRKDKKMVFTEELADYGFEEVSKDFSFQPEEENQIKSLFSGIGDKCIELLTLTIFYNLLMEDIVLRMGFSTVSAAKMQHQRCKQKLILEIEKNPLLKDKIKGI